MTSRDLQQIAYTWSTYQQLIQLKEKLKMHSYKITALLNSNLKKANQIY